MNDENKNIDNEEKDTESSVISNLEIINNLKVDDSWKERFKIIDEWYENGKYFTTRSKKLKDSKFGSKVFRSIYFKNGGLGTIIASYFFGAIYYLFKGLWIKAIVYSLIIILLGIIIIIFLNLDSTRPIAKIGGVFFALLAPIDYYRLKVLGKQW